MRHASVTKAAAAAPAGTGIVLIKVLKGGPYVQVLPQLAGDQVSRRD